MPLCELNSDRFVSGLAKSSRSRQCLRHLQATPSSFITRLACGCVRGELMASRCEHVRRAASASLRALRTIHLSQAGQECPIWPKTVKARAAEGPRECNARALSELICNIAGYGREVSVMKGLRSNFVWTSPESVKTAMLSLYLGSLGRAHLFANSRRNTA